MLRSLLFDLPYYLWKCFSCIHFEFNSGKEHDISLKLRARNEFSRFLFKMMLTYLGTRINIKHSWEISLWKICYIFSFSDWENRRSFNSSDRLRCVKHLSSFCIIVICNCQGKKRFGWLNPVLCVNIQNSLVDYYST